ncbi:MAG: leucine-rich repeat protein [Acholeplasma sp.]|jgi:hypothetical protein|nr:leucine-rich repeat protein [Acholeplasma sp.]
MKKIGGLFLLSLCLVVYLAGCVSSDIIKVTYIDYDGTVLKIESINKGDAPTPPIVPEREGYSFIGWSLELSSISEDVTIQAYYEINSYTVRFFDYFGVIVDSQLIEYESDATPPMLLPVEGFTFTNWIQSYQNIKTNIDIYPKYEKNSYVVSFYDINNQLIKQEEVQHLTSATAPTPPHIEGYHFEYWDNSFNAVTSDLDVRPIYKINTYNVIFKDFNEETIDKQLVEHGSDAVSPGVPHRDGYTFIEWSVSLVEITSDIIVYPIYEINNYHIQFIDDHDNIIKDDVLKHGDVIVPPNPPEKEGFRFIQWSYDLTQALEDIVIYPIYEKLMFTIRFIDDNGELIASKDVEYGDLPEPPLPPEKEGYLFLKWNPEVTPVYESQTYVAIYEVIIIDIIFLNAFDQVWMEMSVGFGESIILDTYPTKEGYSFVKWSESLENIKQPIVVYPIYEINTYTVRFVDPTDQIIKEYAVTYGESITPPSPPVIEGYTFLSWDTNNFYITDHVVIKAIYEANTYRISFFNNEDIISIVEVSHGQAIIPPIMYDTVKTYFYDWDCDLSFAYQDMNVHAIYKDIYTYHIEEGKLILDAYNHPYKTEVILLESLDGYEVSRIVSEAFINAPQIQRLTLPATVQSIDLGAFYGLSSLEYLSIPFIGANRTPMQQEAYFGYIFGGKAFDNTYNSNEYWIPSSLYELTITDSTIISAWSATNLSSIRNLSLPSKLERIENAAFMNLTSLEELVIPASVEYVGEFAFNNARSLSVLSFMENSQLIEIDSNAFSDAISLHEVNLPQGLIKIGDIAFTNANSLEFIEIPSSVEYIGGFAFAKNNLQNVIYEENSQLAYIGSNAFFDNPHLSDIYIPYGVVFIGDYAYAYTGVHEHIIIPDSLSSIGQGIFEGISGLTHLEIPFIGHSRESIDESGRLSYIFNHTGIPSTLIDLVITDSTHISNYALQNLVHLQSLTINEGIISIGDYAIAHTGINSIDIPESVSSIKSFALSDNFDLSEINFHPDSKLSYLGDYALQNSYLIRELTIPESINYIGYGSFSGLYHLESLSTPYVGSHKDSFTGHLGEVFGDIYFLDSYQVHSFYIPLSLKSLHITNTSKIGDSALSNIASLTELKLTDSIVELGDFSLSGLHQIEVLRLPSQLELLGESVLHGLSKLKTLFIPFIGRSVDINETETQFGYLFGQQPFDQSYTSSSYEIPINLTELHVFGAYQIPTYALAYVTSLTHIELSSDIQSIGSYAFSYLTNLDYIILPDSLNHVGEYVFKNTTSLKTMTIPGGLHEIPEFAFASIPNLQSISMSYGVLSIADYAFDSNASLNFISFPDSLISIGAYILSNDDNIYSVYIPHGVTTIDDFAFNDIANLINIEVDDENQNYASRDGVLYNKTYTKLIKNPEGNKLSSIEFAESLLEIADYAFINTIDTIKSIELPNSITRIGKGAFSGASAIESLVIPFIGDTYQSTEVFSYIFGEIDFEDSYQVGNYFLPQSLSNIVITNQSSVQNDAFNGAVSVQAITFNLSLLSIGHYAFANLPRLQMDDIPNTLIYLGEYAYENTLVYHNELTLPNSLTFIGEGALSGSSSLVSLILPFAGQTGDGDELFGHIFGKKLYDEAYITEAGHYIPNSLRSISVTSMDRIPAYTFKEIKYVENLVLPSNLQTIGDGAFTHMLSLKELIVPDSVEFIGRNILFGASHLEHITLPFLGQSQLAQSPFGYLFGYEQYEGSSMANGYHIPEKLVSIHVTQAVRIPDYAFFGLDYVEEITLNNEITYIGKSAFAGVRTMKQIVLPEQLTIISETAFSSCYSLESIHIPIKVISIGDSAFKDNLSLTTITFDDNSELQSIGQNAFESTYLTTIHIPTNVISIGNNAFHLIPSLLTIEVNPLNEAYTSINGVLYDKIISTLIKYPRLKHDETFIVPSTVETILGFSFYSSRYLVDVYIPSITHTIGNYAFSSSNRLQHVFFNEDSMLENINYAAFESVKSLTNFQIPENVKQIGMYAFSGTDSITSLHIPSSISSINPYAFIKMSNLESISVSPDNLNYQSIDGALYNKDMSTLILFPAKNHISSINISDDVENISEYAFFGTTYLKRVIFSEYSPVTELKSNVFFNSQIEEVILPYQLRIISNAAFFGSSIKNLWIGPNVEMIYPNSLMKTMYLESIQVDELNMTYVSYDGVLYTKDKSILIKFPEMKRVNSYTIPKEVLEIEEYAFHENKHIETVNFEENSLLNKVSNYAFLNVLHLKLIDFINVQHAVSITNNAVPVGVQLVNLFDRYVIIDGVYFNSDQTILMKYPSDKIDAIYHIPESVTMVSNDAFYNNQYLQELYVNKNLTDITIGDLPNLNEIFIDPENLQFIYEDGALINKITGILVTYIGHSSTYHISHDYINYISSNAFINANELEEITVQQDHIYFDSLDGVLYSKDYKKLIYVPNNFQDNQFLIPFGVKEISSNAFRYSLNITSIYIPNSVYVVEEAFSLSGSQKIYTSGLNRFVNPPYIIPYGDNELYTGYTLEDWST